ncbi:MAG TPA: hypothetical protein PK411_11495 [Mesotoga infera]|jgi:hypothetical protein|nr:hypothetical protein [Mesotoga sp.]NLI06927.1 hypothetical protein [Thermotogaceae bacterium]HNR78693.1 hypothetical protein [Mesotoga infera]HNS66467.1 hypothetical protein [Mesotoga infera]HON28971.1 hypothetical protein [Mesotoga infera]
MNLISRGFFSLFLIVFLSVGLVASDPADMHSATATAYFEDIAREILKLDSFEDLLKLEGFFIDEPREQPIETTKENPVSIPATTQVATRIESLLEPARPFAATETVYIEYGGGPLPGGVEFRFEPGDPGLGLPDVIEFYKDGVLIDTLSGKTILRPIIALDTPTVESETAVFLFLTGDYATPMGAFYITQTERGIYTLTVAISPGQVRNIVDIDGDGTKELRVLDDHMVKSLEVTELSEFTRFFKWTPDGWIVDKPGDFPGEYAALSLQNLDDVSAKSPRTPFVWSFAYHSYMAGVELAVIQETVSELVEEYSLDWLIEPVELVKVIDLNISDYVGYVMRKPYGNIIPNM